MDRFQEMRVFVRIAERYSFSLAAEDLQIPRTTVTNLIKRLESRLGARLLERTTRQVRLTYDGQTYYQHCIRILADLEEADSIFQEAQPKGILRVNLQGTLAKHFVIPALDQFIAQYPELTLHLEEDDRLVDLVKEGIDCVLRAGNLEDSSLIARRITELEQVTVASPAYLNTYGIPNDCSNLKHHFVISYISRPHGRASNLEFRVGKEYISYQLPSKVFVTGADFYTGAALSGLGIVQVPRYRITREIEDGRLIVLLSKNPPPSLPVSVLYPQNRQLSLRVRVFTQWLAQRFVLN